MVSRKEDGTPEYPYELEEVVVTASTGSPFSINDMVSKISQSGGLAKSNKFKVWFGDETVDWWVEQAELPGRTFETSESRIYGSIYKTPTLSTFQEIQLTFLCDVYLNQKSWFDGWMDRINPVENASRFRNFNFSYREHYVKDVVVQQLSDGGDVTYDITLINAWPTLVQPLQSNWSDDGYQRLQVTLAYDYWVASNFTGSAEREDDRNIASVIVPEIQKKDPIKNPSSFGEAFRAARNQSYKNGDADAGTFEWKGKKYNTQLKAGTSDGLTERKGAIADRLNKELNGIF